MPQIKIDAENNSEQWWDAYRASGLGLGELDDWTEVSSEQLDALKALPGWHSSDAPDYAPNPLLVIE